MIPECELEGLAVGGEVEGEEGGEVDWEGEGERVELALALGQADPEKEGKEGLSVSKAELEAERQREGEGEELEEGVPVLALESLELSVGKGVPEVE